MNTLLFAAWIGVGSLGILPPQSFDYPANPDCDILVTCRAAVLTGLFSDFSFDVEDLGPIAGVTLIDEGITSWSNGHLDWDGVTLRYNTEMGHLWTPQQGPLGLDPHFLFLRSITGRLFVAIEDLPPFWEDGLGGIVAADLDYNDRLYRIEQQAVPEPASLGLLGFGLIGVARAVRRRRAQQRARPSAA